MGVQVCESYGFQRNYIGTDSRTDPADPPGWSDLAERNVISAAGAGVVFYGPGLTDPNWSGSPGF